MALRKEEERKHINNKTGGVFNLIFGHKRGKPSTVSGSISSDNRSISPSHSEDARSVTPPVVQHPPIVAPPKNDPPPDRPKPPQRKRRPAPKPPQIQVTEPVKEEEVKPVPVLPVEEPLNPASRKPSENGVTICHSRNSSDSSGYHEASILSEHCANASLPRARPKSAFVGDSTSHQGTSNLNSMAGHSRSTTSLVGGRRKKAAPPPPPAVPSPSVTPPSSVVAQPSQPSPVVVASQPDSTIQPEFSEVTDFTAQPHTLPIPPKPKPRKKSPSDRPRSAVFTSYGSYEENDSLIEVLQQETFVDNKGASMVDIHKTQDVPGEDYSMEEILTSLEIMRPFIMKGDIPPAVEEKEEIAEVQDIIASKELSSQPPQVIGMIPKTPKDKRRDFKTGSETASTISSTDANSDIVEEAVNPYMNRDNSFASLRSCISEHAPGLGHYEWKKWKNYEELDSISCSSTGVRNVWVAGDTSDTEPISPLDSNSAYPPLTQPVEELIPEIIPCSDIEELGTPPPPPVLEEPTDKEEKSVVDAIVPSEETYEPVEEQSSSHEHPLSEDKSLIEETYEPPPPPIIDQELEFNQITPRAPKQFSQTPQPDLLTLNWEYKLPPPPRPFRDASPTNLTTNRSDTVSEFRDSVVTSPELFEKLRADDNQSDITLKSEVTSVASEEPLNTLSLENLEKRRSLVYNREITTSLKMTDKEQNFRPSPPKPVRNVHSTHTLPNFKITTYEVPKHKNITVFEDDSIRSNTHSLPSGLTKNKLGYSMDNVNQQEKEYNFYKPEVKTNGVSRSGSFSTDNRFSTKPVSRSRSTLTLNKPQFGKRDDNGNISRSNSLFDVSGLQSLEVMKLIQNKLNTPTSSMENINSATKPTSIPPTPKTDTDDEKTSVTSSKSTSPTPVRKYYRGQPSVNVFTWSERPKIPVAVKEDEDYKLGNHATISEEESNISNNNNNNTEITQNSGGNVVIRIGGSTNKPLSNRFVGPVAYRKPFSDLNSRPHSIALPSDFDASRVPIVRSVELKKPFINGNDHLSPTNDSNKRILRVNSFKPFENHVVPVVRGFNTNKSPDIISKRLSWSPANSYSSTLPKQLEKDYSTNKHVPFSQFTLRRTESNRRLTENVPYKSLPTDLETPPAPPPPPQMPKVTLRKAQVEPKSSKAHNSLDARDMLLESIRSFGGKKGLRSTKA
ncbi:uncharacterized protein LOC126734957 isoform X2 [Anthonomus grandis grandis]|nr:uncharacterized protein LOC126734957 isoform X2 [Anthonomus grandis grandis]XP_050294771.1 uncharacterized protein LOC126734957 isoform X2 [Anthonomus grandis grandis]XP_050294772.1 uncharacterized protein LOC126734957 isoform X2 [Anthonomus grandis grandis]XP_050294773.1 uncharacterized protein LOC126734957 isoform X2 [Anthonomus grandis grandis]